MIRKNWELVKLRRSQSHELLLNIKQLNYYSLTDRVSSQYTQKSFL